MMWTSCGKSAQCNPVSNTDAHLARQHQANMHKSHVNALQWQAEQMPNSVPDVQLEFDATMGCDAP